MGAAAGRRGPRLHGNVAPLRILLAGLFGHRRPDEPAYAHWAHDAAMWASAHWAVLAVVIPVAGAIIAGLMNHFLAVARENRARRVSRGDLRARVHADLAVRLLAHCSVMQSGMRAGTADLQAWRAENAALRSRSESQDVIETLGREYVAFVAAIEKERRALEAAAQGRVAQPRAALEIAELYVPFIRDFGEAVQAERLLRQARDAAGSAAKTKR